MMDYNAPPNSWTFGKAQQEFELSSGLSKYINVIIRLKSYVYNKCVLSQTESSIAIFIRCRNTEVALCWLWLFWWNAM